LHRTNKLDDMCSVVYSNWLNANGASAHTHIHIHTHHLKREEEGGCPSLGEAL